MTAPVVLITVNVHGLGPEAAAGGVASKELFARDAHGRYAWRIGMDRLLTALRGWDVPATFFWPSAEAGAQPALVAGCVAEGHEVAAHGRAFEDHAALDPAAEAALLAAMHADLTRIAGVAPVGFRAPPPGTYSAATLGLLRGLGYLYDAGQMDDDAPYPLDGLVALPLSEGATDATHYGRRLPQGRAEAMLREEFLALLGTDGYACLTLHPRADTGSARLSRLPVIGRLIEAARDRGARFLLARDAAALTRAPGGGVHWNGRTRA